MAGAIVAAVVVIFLLILFARTIRIVPQARAGIVERSGATTGRCTPGLTVLVPFIDRLKPLIDLREQVVSFPPQPVITQDNLVVQIDTVLYFTVNDAKSATYEVANPLQAIEQITVTTLRNVIGSLSLEDALTSRDHINAQLRGVLDEATGKWGIRVNRVELKSIDPPGTIQEAMEKQMRAERDRRAAILNAEGVKQSQILTAEGQKQAAVLTAEGAEAGRDPPRRRRGAGDRDRVRGDPPRQAGPGAAELPVPADAAPARTGRCEQGVRDPVRVRRGLPWDRQGGPGSERTRAPGRKRTPARRRDSASRQSRLEQVLKSAAAAAFHPLA